MNWGIFRAQLIATIAKLKIRVKDKVWLAAMISLAYSFLAKNGAQWGLTVPTFEELQTYVDVFCYLVLGFGVYRNFGGDK